MCDRRVRWGSRKGKCLSRRAEKGVRMPGAAMTKHMFPPLGSPTTTFVKRLALRQRVDQGHRRTWRGEDSTAMRHRRLHLLPVVMHAPGALAPRLRTARGKRQHRQASRVRLRREDVSTRRAQRGGAGGAWRRRPERQEDSSQNKRPKRGPGRLKRRLAALVAAPIRATTHEICRARLQLSPLLQPQPAPALHGQRSRRRDTGAARSVL